MVVFTYSKVLITRKLHVSFLLLEWRYEYDCERNIHIIGMGQYKQQDLLESF